MNLPLLPQLIATAIMILGIVFGIQNIRHCAGQAENEKAPL